ncbi:hypothetical protein STEG23_027783 [Scotinomys teguina]
MGSSDESELPGSVLGVVPKSGVVSDPGDSSEVGERLVTSDSAEESEVSPLGEVDVGLRGCSGIRVGGKLASELDGEGSPGAGGDVLGGPVVLSRLEAESGKSCGQEPEVSREPEAGDEVVSAVLAEVGRGSLRAGFGFLGESGGEGKGSTVRSEVSLPHPPCPVRPLEELTNGKAEIFVTSWVTGRLHQALVPPSSPPVRFLPPPSGL